ncbi:MAG: type II toxin-antitoxin system RatA family toxin [Alphaproteobacteria bacterium]|nr:type II toxin-antitoxin system RatA family toxin [Alphaproteobacteria bacterium]
MPQHHETRILPYTAAQMFDLVAAIDRYPEFLPWCKSAHILSRDGDIIVADLVIGYKLFQEKFTSEVTLDRPRTIAVHYKSGPLSHLSNAWQFTPKGRKSCELAFQVDFDFHSPLLRAAMNVFFDKALTKMVAAFEGRAKALYG